jgi:sulfate adenylyltransferase
MSIIKKINYIIKYMKLDKQYPDIVLNKRSICDLELICNGAFSPLQGFMKKNDYLSVLHNMRLESNILFPLPITCPITEEQANKLKHFDQVVLKDETNLPLCIMDISHKGAIFEYDPKIECVNAYGTDDDNHPYVKIIFDQHKSGLTHYIGGQIIKHELPQHYDFIDDRLTPIQTKEYFKKMGWTKILGFQTRNPLHRSHFELTKYALKQAGEGCKLLLHPVVGVTQTCDVEYHTRVRCYKRLIKHYDEGIAKLSLLPLSMRMAGPREAVWHAIIRRNYGCTHFVVGRDHAGPSYKSKDGNSFYGPYDAQDLLNKYKDEIGIDVITSKMIVYAEPKNGGDGVHIPIDKVDEEKYNVKSISGTQQREMLRSGETPPEWFSFPDVVDELRKDFAEKHDAGLCLYFVGLSGSGKSTIANAVFEKLREMISNKKITMLDADIVRQHLSKGLGFSKQDRSTNVRRIGYLCSEIVKHRGLVIVANIGPYKNDREYNKELISSFGNYVQIFVDTNLDECEKRDCKGLYKLAREGKIKEFTGISDPFETPEESDIIIDGSKSIDTLVDTVVNYLVDNGFVKV